MGGHIDNRLFGEPASITTATISSLTASKPVFTDASKLLVSTGTMPVNQGGTNITSYAVGDLLYASTTGVLSKLADVAVGKYLRSGGVNTAPLWSTLTLPNAATAFRLAVATSANTIGELAAVGATGEYLKGNTGAIPSWATLNQAAVAGLTTASTPTFASVTGTAGFVHGAMGTAAENGAFTVDWTVKKFQQVTITGAALDITFTNPSGPCKVYLKVIQGDGDDTIDWTNEADALFPGGVDPTLSTGAGDVDWIAFIWDGTSYHGVANYDFK